MAQSEEVIVISDDEDDNSKESDANAIECPICLQSCIHPVKLPCGHIFCFLCVKGVASKNRRCAMCRREIPPEFLDHPQLVNGIQDICNTKTTEDGYQWFYEGRYGWWQYDDRTSSDIEEAYKKEDKSCTILVAGYVYIVDFEGMVQRRQTDPSRVRHVKRDLATIPKKGVAGLRIEGNTVTTDSNFANHAYEQESENHSPVFETENENDGFLSSISAAHAAIRIANDIIGSTLSLDEPIQTNIRSINGRAGSSSGTQSRLNSRNGSSSSQDSTSTSDLVSNEPEEVLLDGLDTRGSSRPVDQTTIDLFQQTLDNFRSLTLANIGDFSDSETEDLLL
ncbi:RNF146 family protein [Megaselia abdita]